MNTEFKIDTPDESFEHPFEVCPRVGEYIVVGGMEFLLVQRIDHVIDPGKATTIHLICVPERR